MHTEEQIGVDDAFGRRVDPACRKASTTFASVAARKRVPM
jgi:hypothetical protein